FEDSARFFAPTFERDFRRRQQLRLIVVQVARDPRPFLVDSGEHPDRKLTDQSAATRRLLFHYPVGDNWTEPGDDCLGAGSLRAIRTSTRCERHRATVEWDTYKWQRVRVADGVGEVGAGNDYAAAEAFLEGTPSEVQVDYGHAWVRGRDFESILTRDCDDPLVEAGMRSDQFAKAREALDRLRIAHRRGRCLEAARCAAFTTQVSFRHPGVAATLRAVGAPEIRQRARVSERDLGKHTSCHKFQQSFKLGR